MTDASADSPLPATQSRDGVSHAIVRLEAVAARLRRLGLTILGLTMGTAAALTLIPTILGGAFPYRSIIIFVTLDAFVAFGMIAAFEVARKEGNAIFEEISDELQWQAASSHSPTVYAEGGPEVAAAREKPSIEARLSLRSFTRACDLPLVPGAFGPAAYAIINMALVILSYILPRYLF